MLASGEDFIAIKSITEFHMANHEGMPGQFSCLQNH